jgi:uncharacterized UBP type Zn finger protein
MTGNYLHGQPNRDKTQIFADNNDTESALFSIRLEFPRVLNLFKYTEEAVERAIGKTTKIANEDGGRTTYYLLAVVSHAGNAQGGHYTAYIDRFLDNTVIMQLFYSSTMTYSTVNYLKELRYSECNFFPSISYLQTTGNGD